MTGKNKLVTRSLSLVGEALSQGVFTFTDVSL